MTSKAQDVYRAFLAGRIARPASALWTDGETLYSYETALITRTNDATPDGPRFVANFTKYSRTSTAHLNGALDLIRGRVVTVANLPKGTTAKELLAAALNISGR